MDATLQTTASLSLEEIEPPEGWVDETAYVPGYKLMYVPPDRRWPKFAPNQIGQTWRAENLRFPHSYAAGVSGSPLSFAGAAFRGTLSVQAAPDSIFSTR